MQTQLVARGRSRANLGMWSTVLIAGSVAVAAAIIYQVGFPTVWVHSWVTTAYGNCQQVPHQVGTSALPHLLTSVRAGYELSRQQAP
jgi:hypothetical protein